MDWFIPEDDTWEPLLEIKKLYPNIDLEDNVCANGLQMLRAQELRAQLKN